MEGVDQGVAVDEVVLEGQQAEEQVAIGVDAGHGTGLLDIGPGRGRRVPDVGSLRPGREPDRLDYRMTDHPMQPGRGPRAGPRTLAGRLAPTCDNDLANGHGSR